MKHKKKPWHNNETLKIDLVDASGVFSNQTEMENVLDQYQASWWAAVVITPRVPFSNSPKQAVYKQC